MRVGEKVSNESFLPWKKAESAPLFFLTDAANAKKLPKVRVWC